MACRVHLGVQLRGHGLVNPLGRGGRHVGRVVDQEGHVILVVHAVGHVVVHKKVGQPAVKHLQESAGLRRVGLHVVAIQIQIGPVAAPARQLGPVLVDPVVG